MTRDSKNLILIVTALLAVGVVILFSSSAIYAAESKRIADPYFFLKRQMIWILVGATAMIAASRIRPDLWRRLGLPLLGAAFVLLALVFVPGIGSSHNTVARRWLQLGPFSFQPSEMAKLALSIFLASLAASDPDRFRSFFRGFLPAALVTGAAAGLVVLEPDLGSAVLLVTVSALVMFVSGARPAHFAPFLLLGGLLVALVLLKHEYMRARVEAWLDPWGEAAGDRGHQIRQSLLALGSGGWTGSGLGRGTQKMLFLPEGHTDFILANLGEELGLLGVGGVVLLYLSLGMTAWRICRRSADPFAFTLSFALTAYILLQAAVNIAVVTAAVPTKGIPLPLLSYGGSSLLFTLTGVGILIGISESGERRTRGECASSSPGAAPAAISSPALR